MSRRVRGEGSIYERKDGTYSGQLNLGLIGGKRRRRTVYGKTEGEVARKLRDARREMEAGNLNTSSTTVEQWLRYWLEEIAPKKVKPSTLYTYRAYADRYIIPAVGHRRLDRLTPAHVREMHTAMAGKSTTTALQAHRILSGAIKAAMREGRVMRNVASASFVDLPSKAESDRTGLTGDEGKAVMTAALDRPLTSRWWAALLTGARQGECLGLRWEHVDLDRAVVDLAWSLQRVPYSHGCGKRVEKVWPCGRRFGADCPTRHVEVKVEHRHLGGNLYLLRPKTKGSRRVVPLLPAMVAALRLHAETDTGPNPHGLVWHRDDGRPLDPREDWQAWHELLAAAGVRKVTLHEARHTVATLLMEGGFDPHIISSFLGHSSIVTTRGYQNVSLDLARQALTALGERLGLPGGDAAA